MNAAREQQPSPKPSKGDVWLAVIRDMEERRQFGIEKYGTPVQAFNGRNAILDAYQEALDLCVYFKQALIEQADKKQEDTPQTTRHFIRKVGDRWDLVVETIYNGTEGYQRVLANCESTEIAQQLLTVLEKGNK